MSTQTIGPTLPAIAGTCAAAPSKTQVDSEAGWAMLPHSIAADARLTAVDIRVALALLYFARSRSTCTPCDRSIGDRAGGISPGTVQRSLRRLEALGYIRREAVAPTDANRTGRVLHLLWKTGGATVGERPAGHRRVAPRSPARDKENVVVEEKNSRIETDSTLRSRPDQFTQAPTITTPDTQAPTAVPIGALPFDLRAIGQPAGSPPTTVPPAHRRQRPRLGLTLEELASVAGDDPILAAELARRTAPPKSAEPPPATVPTAELFEALPGRHDLIMIAARRLCEETNDFKPASQRTFEKMAEAVATRAVPPAVLLDCWCQGMGPKSEHKGKVLVAAWKRSVAEVPLHR